MTEWIQNASRRINIYHQPTFFQNSENEVIPESHTVNQAWNDSKIDKNPGKGVSVGTQPVNKEDMFDVDEEVDKGARC